MLNSEKLIAVIQDDCVDDSEYTWAVWKMSVVYICNSLRGASISQVKELN